MGTFNDFLYGRDSIVRKVKNENPGQNILFAEISSIREVKSVPHLTGHLHSSASFNTQELSS